MDINVIAIATISIVLWIVVLVAGVALFVDRKRKRTN